MTTAPDTRHIYSFNVFLNDSLVMGRSGWQGTYKTPRAIASFYALNREKAWDAAERFAAENNGHTLWSNTYNRELMPFSYESAMAGWEAPAQFSAHFAPLLDAGLVVDLIQHPEWWANCPKPCCK